MEGQRGRSESPGLCLCCPRPLSLYPTRDAWRGGFEGGQEIFLESLRFRGDSELAMEGSHRGGHKEKVTFEVGLKDQGDFSSR